MHLLAIQHQSHTTYASLNTWLFLWSSTSLQHRQHSLSRSKANFALSLQCQSTVDFIFNTQGRFKTASSYSGASMPRLISDEREGMCCASWILIQSKLLTWKEIVENAQLLLSPSWRPLETLGTGLEEPVIGLKLNGDQNQFEDLRGTYAPFEITCQQVEMDRTPFNFVSTTGASQFTRPLGCLPNSDFDETWGSYNNARQISFEVDSDVPSNFIDSSVFQASGSWTDEFQNNAFMGILDPADSSNPPALTCTSRDCSLVRTLDPQLEH